MLLRGVNIESRFLLHQNFSYKEVVENFDKSPYIYADMITKHFKPYRFEDNRLLRHLLNIPKYFRDKDVVGANWVDMSGYLHLDVLNETLDIHLKHFNSTESQPPPPPLDDARFKNSVIRAILDATDNGKRRLNTAAVLELELMIFFHLHATSLVEPEAQALLKKRVEALCFDMDLPGLLNRDTIQLPDSSAALSLPLYREGEGPLSIVQFTNPSDHPVTLTLTDSSLRRTVHPGQSAFAIKKCNAIVDFLPSFSVQGNVVYEAEAAGLKLSRDEQVRHVSLGYMPASWATSRAFGSLVLNKDGLMDHRHALSSALVSGSAAAVAADGNHFCVLNADGSVHSNFEKHGHVNVIAISLCHQRTAAISDVRSAILDDGSIIRHANAARALVCNDFYLVLTCNGDARTDESFPGGTLPLPGPASAIALSEDLYAAAVESCILIYNADGSERCRIQTAAAVEEMVLQAHTLYYRDPKTGWIEKKNV